MEDESVIRISDSLIKDGQKGEDVLLLSAKRQPRQLAPKLKRASSARSGSL